MQQLIDYFETIPSWVRSLILVGGITFFWVLEYGVPLFNFNYKKVRHAIPNIFFTLTTVVVNFLLAFLLLKSSDWVSEHEFGIIHLFPLPLWASVLIGLLVLDFVGAWLAHWVQHKIKPLWMFHLIHHTDNFVDTTTANRHHPGESVIRFFFTLLGVLVGGLPIGIVLLYQSLSVVFAQLTHANIRLPKKLDTAISWILVSPDMHKVHHHYKLPYTDTNYGNIFSIWDRLLGTFSAMKNEDLIYGIDTYPDVDSNTHVGRLLKLPFNKYRAPDGGKFE
ncbi:fatty acid hydroxylase [Galbibacter marinus]|uniref:Fatty acid hydroxylase n=1 Tax=Galbibacter marinus TaxID=555500 RepID=K2QNC7_9FLAO|nr:sterol desaturase family protein [Galbibacter marinus]EKF56337.1 fatty acid hydroxylase [Galbibacter marinus]